MNWVLIGLLTALAAAAPTPVETARYGKPSRLSPCPFAPRSNLLLHLRHNLRTEDHH
jgi:hypothetical protein